MQKGLLLIFGLLIFGLQWGIGGNECGVLEEVEVVEDSLYAEIYFNCTTLADCYNCKRLEVVISTGNYPPYEVTYITEDYSMSKVLLEGERFFESVCISEWETYEVYVVDSVGNEFYYTSEFWCSHLPQCYPSWQPYQLQCNGDGTATVQFDENEHIEEAFWTAPDGHKQTLEDGDVVLDRSYLQFFQMCGGQSDTLVNCFSATDDYWRIGIGRERGFNVFENDFGGNLEVSEVLKMPVCGELESWSSSGHFRYNLGGDVSCEMDRLSYVLTNDFGQKDTATIWVEVEQEPTLILNWEVECHTEALGLVSVTVENGIPPYSIYGLYNEMIVENYFDFLVPQNANDFVEVVDAVGNHAKFVPSYWGDCIGDCYELADKTYWGAYTIECNEDGTANIEGVQNDNYRIRKSFWIDADGTYHSLDFAEIGNITFPNHSYFYVETKQNGHIDGFINCLTSNIEAVDDFGSAIPGEPLNINVLANDKGDGFRLTQIVTPPQCGEILEWSEYGEVVYVASDVGCDFDTFVYEVEDNWGEKAQAAVTVLVIDTTPKLEVQYEWDPCGQEIEDFYYVTVAVNGNHPPFYVDVNGVKDTLMYSGIVFFQVAIGELFEIYVIDNIGQDYYAIGGETNCWGYISCNGEPNEKPTFNCIGGGKVRVETSDEFLENAYWMDLNGVSHSLKQIDTIPNLSYLSIPQLENYDTLVNCLAANDDYFEVPVGIPYSFEVLGNDFGQAIQVSNILQMPACGELIEWSADGEMTYKVGENEVCLEDFIVYEIENELGEKATAMVELGVNPNENMYLEWTLECEDWSCYLEVTIKGGVAPYIVTGYLNEVIEDNHFTIQVFCGEEFTIQVTDSNGQTDIIQSNTNAECSGAYEYCYEPEYINQYLEVECLGEIGGIVNYLLRMNFATIENAFYITSNNEYHTFTESDTIPNNSYYYLELKYLGHIDGYIKCLTTDIEEETNIPVSNSFLQLYPNPNQGQFSLQLQTSNSSLQSYPVQIYNTAGQSIWKGTLQSNRLETLDLGNVGSGLYVLQVVTEKEVLVERFWVE